MAVAFTVRHFLDLVTLLEKHPEWRQELRRLILTDDILSLPQAARELVEAHKRAEERLSRLEAALAELAEAQRRTEQRVEELAEAQRRTEEEFRSYRQASEERFARIEAALAELAEAQRRTEQRVEELAEAQRRTDERVSRLDARLDRLESLFGATVEEEAADVLRVVLEQKGYRALGAPIYWRPDGDIDVVLPLEDPKGQRIHAVLEAKVRMGWRAVEDWANRMRSEGFRSRLAKDGLSGPYLVYVYAIRPDTSAEAAARTFGIGLLSPRGEVVPPRGLE